MNTPTEQPTRRIVVGLLAHVDAGKTTLAEGLLLSGGAIRTQGRVDHRDSFLDTDSIERARGITVLTKPAVFSCGDTTFTLLDTPGHMDFSAEAERALAVLDAAVLVISASENVGAHTKTLWQLLKLHRIPTFLFINKMDLPHLDRSTLLCAIEDAFSCTAVDFSNEETTDLERAAGCSEALIERYLTDGTLPDEAVADAVSDRLLFPAVFGSALKNDGTARLLDLLCRYARPAPPEWNFGARVIKIAYDGADRLTYLKITGGRLKVKDTLTNLSAGLDESAVWAEKVNEIRIFSGKKSTAVSEALPGCVCAVTGLTKTYPGEGLGSEVNAPLPMLSPVISYAVALPAGANKADAYEKLKRLSEEDPLLHVESDGETGELRVWLMGQVQAEVVTKRALDRFGLVISFDSGRVLYRETIADTVLGIGHFEPLRHYAHVELRLSPAPPGSGLAFRSEVSSDVLSKNWQRLILTHLSEKTHLGVLTGAPVTDVLITLTYGKAHLKHTEGGDFRQATYRAVRQGLMQAKSVLLEPYYRFTLTLPAENLGRAMTDMRRMCGETDAPLINGAEAVLTGSVPVSAMGDYARELTGYTHGLGSISLLPGSYRPCHNANEVIAAAAYDPEADLKNTPDSVFCAHGAGFPVKWSEVAAYIKAQHAESDELPAKTAPSALSAAAKNLDAQLTAIYERTYGPIKGAAALLERRKSAPADTAALLDGLPPAQSYLLVDGYNILFAWERLRIAAREHIGRARELLTASLVNYQALKGCNLILVFDAYKVTGGAERIEQTGGIYVVYTREAEIADVYIEKAARALEHKQSYVRVATSDALEQLIILGKGALRVSANAFIAELEQAEKELRALMEQNHANNKGSYCIWETRPPILS